MKTFNKSMSLLLVIGMMTSACSSSDPESVVLNERFQRTNVSFVDEKNGASGDLSGQASILTIAIALSILPPATTATGGTAVYASDLKVSGNRVITTYNVRGAVQRGWIDLIDTTTLAVPLLLDSKYLADTDVNSVSISGGNFALVGAKDGAGSVLRTGSFSGVSLTLNSTETSLSSYAGTGVVHQGSNIAVTSGDGGSMNLLNATTLANVANSNVTDARDIIYHAGSSKYWVVKGQPGAVLSYNSSGVYQATTSLGGATIAESKSTIKAGTNFVLATMGDGGFALICAADGQVALTQGQYVYPNYASTGKPGPTLTVTNAATLGPGLIFTAAGEAGVRIYELKKKSGGSPTACQNVQTSYLGYLEFGTAVSANNLQYINILTTLATYTGILYVATGSGGFKAVTITATRDAFNDIVDF